MIAATLGRKTQQVIRQLVSKARAIAIASCPIADDLEMAAHPVTHQSDKTYVQPWASG
jgi:hypothetical protein